MNVRDVFFSEIYNYTKQGEDICIVSADLGAPSLDLFRRDFGNRFINVGIAEQNLLSVSAGLALSGKKVIAFGLNPFPVTRAYDQLRNLMASLQVPFTLAALNAGTCSAEAGYTHLPIENMAVLRPLKNITIWNPSDETTAKLAAEKVVFAGATNYIQFDKYISGIIYSDDEIDIPKGFASYGDGKDFTIVTNGFWVSFFRSKLEELQMRGINIRIIDCFALPVSKDLLIKELDDAKQIVCVEDNCREGGLGSMVLELLSDYSLMKQVRRIALDLPNGYSLLLGNRDFLFQREGLNWEKIFKRLLKWKKHEE